MKEKIIRVRVLWILKRRVKKIRVVLCPNTSTRLFQVNQPKRQKKGKQFPRIQNKRISFKESLQNHNISLILILTGLENIYDKGTCFSKVCTLNVFHIKSLNIGLHFLLQLKLQNKQVELDSIQTNLLWSNSKVTKTVVASVVKLLLWKCQTNLLL